jgi:Ca2+-binding EF-hand superfamily protein
MVRAAPQRPFTELPWRLNSNHKTAERTGGAVDFQFFLKTMARWVGAAESEAEMIAAWRQFDRQGTGYLTQEEFRYAMTSFGNYLLFRSDMDDILTRENNKATS